MSSASVPREQSDEQEIRRIVESFADAFRARDVEAIVGLFADDIVSFDLVPPLQCVGREPFRGHWERTFAADAGPIDYEIEQLDVTVAGDLAVSRSLNHKQGTNPAGGRTDQWLRWTACFERRSGRWLITHEHVSVPMDPASGRALTDLTPQPTEGR